MRLAYAIPLAIFLFILGLGGYMLTHGYAKLGMIADDRAATFPDPLGIGNELSLWMAVLVECGGAACVVLGLLTRPAAAALVFTMGVAAFVHHADDPWTMSRVGGSKEPALLYLIPFLALVFTGPGRLALDGWVVAKLRARRSTPAAP